MPQFGTHAFTLEGDWNDQLAPQVIAQAAELGFDFLEIPIGQRALLLRGEEGNVLWDCISFLDKATVDLIAKRLNRIPEKVPFSPRCDGTYFTVRSTLVCLIGTTSASPGRRSLKRSVTCPLPTARNSKRLNPAAPGSVPGMVSSFCNLTTAGSAPSACHR